MTDSSNTTRANAMAEAVRFASAIPMVDMSEAILRLRLLGHAELAVQLTRYRDAWARVSGRYCAQLCAELPKTSRLQHEAHELVDAMRQEATRG